MEHMLAEVGKGVVRVNRAVLRSSDIVQFNVPAYTYARVRTQYY